MPGRIILRSASDGTYESKGTPVFSDDFETGDFSLWSGPIGDTGDMSVSTDQKYAGSYSLKHLLNGGQAYIEKVLTTGVTTELWVHHYIYFSAVSDSGAANGYIVPFEGLTNGYVQSGGTIFRMDNGSPPEFYQIVVRYMNSSESYTELTGSFVPSAATWYEVKIQFLKVGAGSDIVKCWVGTPGSPSLVIDQTALSFSSGWEMRRMWLGAPIGPGLGTWTSGIMFIDNFEVAGSDIW
jgi:hypothetical protein